MKKCKGIFNLVLVVVMLLMLTPASMAQTKAIVTVENVVSNGGSVDVPIRISENGGICGAIISVLYDENLVLTNVNKGTALSSLTMTKPGDLSANPINLVWDGIEADNTDGVIATLTFTVPSKPGEYDISVSYEEGEVVDGDLLPVSLVLNYGGIKVDSSNKKVTVTVAGNNVILFGEDNAIGNILAVFYDENDRVISVKSHAASSNINVDAIDNASYVKIMWWENLTTLKPICEAQTVGLE